MAPAASQRAVPRRGRVRRIYGRVLGWMGERERRARSVSLHTMPSGFMEKKKKRVTWRTQGQRGKKERYGCLCFSLSFCVGARRVERDGSRDRESWTVDSRLINPDGSKGTNDNCDDKDDDEGAQPALPEAGRHPPEQQAVDEEGQLRAQAVRGGHLGAVLRMEDDDRECSQSA